MGLDGLDKLFDLRAMAKVKAQEDVAPNFRLGGAGEPSRSATRSCIDVRLDPVADCFAHAELLLRHEHGPSGSCHAAVSKRSDVAGTA
jgi:hypothetical protein